MKKRKLTALLSALLCIALAAGCGRDAGVRLKYDNGVADNGLYDTGMFFRNDLNLNHAADPGVIWVSKEEHEYGGYFYMYATTIYNNFIAARSRDLNTWEFLGPVIDWSLGSDASQWCVNDLWAPEVIHNPADGKYYMYFTGAYDTQAAWADHYIGVAVSDSPAGPFVYYEGRSYFGETLTKAAPTIDFNIDHAAGTPYEYRCGIPVEKQSDRFATDPKRSVICDANPFYDDDGTLYLYFSFGYYQSMDMGIWGVRMLDAVTPDYNSLTRLTCPGYRTLKDLENEVVFDLEVGSTLNEAPHMIKHDGVYYLTFAPNRYTYRTLYSVAVAVADSPLGTFDKLKGEHGNPALYIEAHMDHMAGPGHHSFAFVGEEMFVFYHSLMDRATGNSNPRGIAYDRITFIDGADLGIDAAEYGIESETGTFDILYANGPTWSLQPLPAVVNGYKNVAGEATVTAEKAKADTIRYINDGLFVSHEYAGHMEYEGEKGTSVTLTFAQPKEVAAIIVYNSYDFSYAFKYIDRITFELAQPPASLVKGSAKKVYIRNLGVNADYYDRSTRIVRPGSGAVARFDPILVKKITVEVSAHLDDTSEAAGGIRISDIAVLAK